MTLRVPDDLATSIRAAAEAGLSVNAYVVQQPVAPLRSMPRSSSPCSASATTWRAKAGRRRGDDPCRRRPTSVQNL